MTSQPLRTARSHALFEEFEGFPKAPPMPVQPLDHPEALKSLGVTDAPLARYLVRAAFLLTGYTHFHRSLPNRLDSVMEATNQIVAIGPTVAATMALIDAPSLRDPFIRAAAMLKACWDVHSTIRTGQFRPDMYKGQPLEMRQYLNLFGTSIVFDKDTFRLSKTANVSRILVLARGKSYILEFAQDTNSTSVNAVADALHKAWNLAAADRFESSAGVLGTLSSVSLDIQAEGLRAILDDPSNVRSYEAVQDTFLTLCLDLEHTPRSDAEAALAAHSRNCANRDFYSSLQLVIFANGKACVICDFNAGIGGNTMFRAAAEIHRRSLQWAVPRTADAASEPARIEEARWKVDQGFLKRAHTDLNQVLDDQQPTFELVGYGRAAFASHGLEPVPAFAIAVQLAVLRLTGRFARIRQFVTLARFRSQNVALASVSTPEMAELVHALMQPHQSEASLRQLMEAALASQKKQYRQARSSMSVARTLYLFRAVQEGMTGRYVELVLGGTFRLLRALNLQEPPLPPTDIALSHPELFPEVPVMGRPGIRLPYLQCFGLHYLIWDDRITLTLMPSTKWTIPNAALVAELETCLNLISELWSGNVPKMAMGSASAGASLVGSPQAQTNPS
jgi:hypothetical protein